MYIYIYTYKQCLVGRFFVGRILLGSSCEQRGKKLFAYLCAHGVYVCEQVGNPPMRVHASGSSRTPVSSRSDAGIHTHPTHHSNGMASMSRTRFLPTNSLMRSSISVQPDGLGSRCSRVRLRSNPHSTL